MELVLAFDTDDPQFARGFEAGRLAGRMEHEHRIEQILSVDNAEMVMRIAEWLGWTFSGQPLDDYWLTVTLERGAETQNG
jgi:hypothetical protein